MTNEIKFAPLSTFYFDPKNPRLARFTQDKNTSQREIYDLLRDWSLEELATSFLESGYWVHEAVLCTLEEQEDGEEHLVVIEGNRRIAALRRLQATFRGEEKSRKWTTLINGVEEPTNLFECVPYILIANRQDIDAFLGFRHVTGIKEWAPPEKAQFISKLIEDRGYSYREVMRKIGSKTPVVERHYVAYCILRQMESIEGLGVEEVQDRFSVLFLSLRSSSVREFLGVTEKFNIEPKEVMPPIGKGYIDHLREYSLWLFGDKDNQAVVTDSRDMDKFAAVLASKEGLQYLRSVPEPSIEKAFVIAGGSKKRVYDLVSSATYNLQEALSMFHFFKEDDDLISVSKKLIANVEQVKKTLGIV